MKMSLRKLPVVIQIAAACVAVTSHAQIPVCRENGTSQDSAVCAHQDHVKADARLNDAYRAALNRLNADAKAALVTAQRDWIKYRDADCEVQDRIFQNGTMRDAIVESCLKELTEQRTRELEQIWLP